jgi:hypothetical protein
MSTTDLRIEASHEDLAMLKELLYESIDDVDLSEDTERHVGEHTEPVLIGLVVALGGATLTREVLRTIRHWMDKRVAHDRLRTIRFYIEGADGSRDTTLEKLMASIE